MGQSRSRHCTRDADSRAPDIMPKEDPLTKALSQAIVSRIVLADISRDFEVLPQVLGTGFSGAVLLAKHRLSGQKVAVKQFTKKRLKGHRMDLLRSEVEVYLRLDHPNVCKLLYAYESKHDVWLVMELCACELYARVCERKAYREHDAADVMLQMFQAVNYLHSRNIVHRDLKLENWMYGETASSSTAPARDERIKLIDFGFSRMLSGADERLELPCGTLHYTSPQVLTRNYTSKCDIWSLGVIAYMLLLGRPPFRGENTRMTAKAIMAADFPKDKLWRSLSEDATDFVSKLLEKDARKRPTASEALLHPWLMNVSANGLNGSGVEIGTDVLRSLRKFASSSHLRRAVLLVMAYSLTSRELQDVEKSFLALDKAGTGIVTLDSLAEVLREYLGPEVTSSEITRILGTLDVASDEGVHYTSFVAAMLATRVQINEDKVRAAFEAFDKTGNGYITAESLVSMYAGLADDGDASFSKEDAQRWINEVDYRRNGVIDYDGFLQALQGKIEPTVPLLETEGQMPTVRVFEDSGISPRTRGLSESYAKEAQKRAARDLGLELAAAIIDGEEKRRRATYPGTFDHFTQEVQVRNTTLQVDDNYFEKHGVCPVAPLAAT